MIHKWLLWLSNIAAVIILAFWNGCMGFIAAHPYLILPVYAGAWITCYIAMLALLWIFFWLVGLTINIHKTYEKQSRFYGVLFAWLLDSAVWLSGADVTITGMEKVPKPSEGRFLFVSNHKSVFDTFIQVAAFRKYPLAFISKPENFKIPVGHRYMTRCRYMAIDRGDVRDGARITNQAAKMISSGDCCVGVYPEGTRNRTEELLIDFKPGCFKSAIWAKAPIVIGVVHNSSSIRKNFPFHRTKVHFEIVDVLPFEMIQKMKTQDISDLVRSKMLERLK